MEENYGKSDLTCSGILGVQLWLSFVVSLVNPACHNACRFPTGMAVVTSISISMLCTSSVFYNKVILLESLQPSGNLALWMTETQEPLQSGVVSSEQELSSIEVDMEVFDSLHHG